MRRLWLLLFVVFLLSAWTLNAQTVPAQAAQTAKLTGRVMDSSGAVMPGAEVRVFQGPNMVKEGVADSNGDFAFDLAPGDYRLEVASADFNPFREEVRVIPNMGPLAVSMTLAVIATNVQVTASSDQVSVDPESSLSNQTISGDQLQDLPDNEEDLAAYLQQLAGGTGTDAEFVIDGFTGGRLPPRDQIQQIIINNNPFSAEGRGQGARIQIIRRPGTGNWQGNFNASFRDESLNAKNPFDPSKPSSQTRNFTTNVSGPIIPNILGMNFSGRSNETEAEAGSIRAITPDGTIAKGVVAPTVTRGLETRGQLFLSQVHGLNFGLNYSTTKRDNQGVGGFNLAERASNSRSHNWEAQISERAVFSSTMINEARFSVRTDSSRQAPVTEGVAINVLDAFFGGGGQNRSEDKNTAYQFGNTLRWTMGPKWNFQAGTEGDYTKSHSVSENNFIGTFVFSSLTDYLANRPLTFTQNSGDPVLDVNQFEMSTFVQADFRVTQKSNLGMGLRYQAQSNLDDYNNFAPTLSFAYQIAPRTVFRAGSRIAYQGFGMNNVEQLLRNDGTTRQFQTVISNPSYPNPFLGDSGTVNPTTSARRTKAEDFISPYTINSSVTLEQGLPRNLRMVVSYDTNRGIHQLRTRNINAPFPGLPLPADLLARLTSRDIAERALARAEVDLMRPFYPIIGNINQYESVGTSFSKNINLRLFTQNLQLGPIGFGGMMNYTLGWSEDDNGTPVNSYDWASEWARSSQDSRHRVQGNVNLRFPWTTNVNFNFRANSSRPFNITTGRDENGDTSTNDRPVGTARNTGIGPSTYNVDLNFSKTFFINRQENPQGTAANTFAQQGGGGFGGGGFGGNQGGGNPGGNQGGGQQRGGNQGGFGNPTGPTLVFNVRVGNLFNNTQLSGYSGVMTSPFFGRASNATNPRRIELALNMRF